MEIIAENPATIPGTRRVHIRSRRTKKLNPEDVREEMHDVHRIIEFIKDLRLARRIAQKDICAGSGLSASTVSKMENESCGLNIRTLVLVLRQLGYRLTLSCEPLPEQNSGHHAEPVLG